MCWYVGCIGIGWLTTMGPAGYEEELRLEREYIGSSAYVELRLDLVYPELFG